MSHIFKPPKFFNFSKFSSNGRPLGRTVDGKSLDIRRPVDGNVSNGRQVLKVENFENFETLKFVWCVFIVLFNPNDEFEPVRL